MADRMADRGHETILVLVHPGSACGSADANLGRLEAGAARNGLIWELDHWEGGLLVIDGDFSDELPGRPLLACAIEQCLRRASDCGAFSRRVVGNDPDQVARARECVQELVRGGRTAAGLSFIVTGAWYDPSDGSGCVGSVVQELKRLGCSATVSEHAVCVEEETDEEFEQET